MKAKNLKVIIITVWILSMLVSITACGKDPEGKSIITPTPEPAPSESPSPVVTAIPVKTFPEGTSVNGIDISGLELDEASAKLSSTVKELTASYSCRMTNGTESFAINANDITVGTDLDAILEQAFRKGGAYELKLRIADDERLQAILDSLSEQINTAPKQQRLKVNTDKADSARFRIINGKSGIELDTEETRHLILSGTERIDLPLIEIKACDTEISIPVLRGSFATEFNAQNINRSFNLAKAASLLNGLMLAPGEELSFDRVLGERNEENGWKLAEAYTNGGLESVEQYGGGICQVSTTLYNAALRADLSIPYRSNHSKPVSYVPAGLDAAISRGSIDLVIRNNTESNIYIFMWISGNGLHCEIYGDEFPKSFDYIEVISEFVESIPPGEAEFVDDYSLPYGETKLISPPVTGSVYRSYRVYYLNNTEVRRVLAYESRYRNHAAVYAVGKMR